MSLLPKSIHRCRRYPTKFNSGRDIPRFLPSLGLLVSLATTGSAFAQSTKEPQTFLKTHAGFSEEDLRAIEQGSVIVKTVRTPSKEEVTIVGAALFKASTAFFLRMYRDIERFESGLGPLKKLSDPPQAEDFAPLTLPDKDLKDLAKCRVGDCDLKLGEESIARFQTEVNWSSLQAHQQAMALVRELGVAVRPRLQRGGQSGVGSRPRQEKTDLYSGRIRGTTRKLTVRSELHPGASRVSPRIPQGGAYGIHRRLSFIGLSTISDWNRY